MNLIDEITETINLLESQIPANPASEKNEKLESQMQKSLADYFKNLNDALDWNKLETIYYRNVKQE
jgi:predicted unusual protein kinase regulating ubiquinone biosynthesis (AarF/ABC1/UbiB family)